MNYGPQIPACKEVYNMKYPLPNESFSEACARQAAAMSDSEEHRSALKEMALNQRILWAGRVQSAMGAPKNVTAFNCFVSGIIEDSMDSIMDKAKEAAETMRRGGGIGYDFSRIRPSGDRIVSLGSPASGPVSFMRIFDSVCDTIMSAGLRRGAMMAVLRVDHPDIEHFIRAKRDEKSLTNFNISVGITTEFMEAVAKKGTFDLKFNGQVYDTIDATFLWDEIMRSTWDYAEPGVIFLDQINKENNAAYLEVIEATNPCGEQPLPPYGACLLSSFNLVKYIKEQYQVPQSQSFDFKQFKEDIPHVVRALDNVIDRTEYPLLNKRRKLSVSAVWVLVSLGWLTLLLSLAILMGNQML